MNEHTQVREDNGTTVSLREYIEAIIAERDKAVQAAYRSMELRLDKLNELRSEVQQDRTEFLRIDVYDTKHEALSKQLDDLASWRLKATGVFLVLVPLSGVIGAAIMKVLG